MRLNCLALLWVAVACPTFAQLVQPPPVTTASSPSEYVYVAGKDAESIFGFKLGPDGHLTPLTPASVHCGRQPTSVVIIDQNLYVANSGDSTIAQFSIQKDGALRPLVPSAVETDDNAVELVAALDGKSVYEISGNDADILHYQRSGDGCLHLLTGSHNAESEDGVSVTMALEPTGHNAYAITTEDLTRFSVGKDGDLKKSGDVQKLGTGITQSIMSISGVCFDPLGHHVFITDQHWSDTDRDIVDGVSFGNISSDGSIIDWRSFTTAEYHPRLIVAGNSPESLYIACPKQVMQLVVDHGNGEASNSDPSGLSQKYVYLYM